MERLKTKCLTAGLCEVLGHEKGLPLSSTPIPSLRIREESLARIAHLQDLAKLSVIWSNPAGLPEGVTVHS